MKIIKSVDKKIVVKLKKFDPTEFFKNREGLYVWSSFKDNILDKAKTIEKESEFKISSYDLVKFGNDEEIEKELPEKHLFSETDVCALIASLIEKQPKGEEGTLQNNGYANLFYTSSHVVVVRWSGGEWSVYDWYRRDGRWGGGPRVFAPATES